MWKNGLSGLAAIAWITYGVIVFDQELVSALVRDGYIGAAVYAARPSIVCAFGALVSMLFLVWLSRKKIVAVSTSVWISVAGFVVGMKKWPSACWGYFKQIPGKVKKWPSACREYVKQIPGKVKRWPGLFWRWLKNFFGMLYSPSLKARIVLGLIPFVVLGAIYHSAEQERKAKNPDDRMLPSVGQMYDEVAKYVTDRDMRTKQLTFVTDTLGSLKRVCYGVVIGAAIALIIGLFAGVYPWFRSMIMPIVISLSTIIPVTILAILMIVFGTDEVFKIAFVCFGITFLLIRNACSSVQALPAEQKIKMLTLGGKSLSYIFYIVIPQILPRFIETVSEYLGPAWGYVMFAEMMKADSGLAFRILIVKRSTNMPLIISIVLFVAVIAYAIYLVLRLLNKAAFPWYFEVKK